MLLRQLRGAFGVTLLWGVLWFPLGLGLGLWRFLSMPLCHEFVDGNCFGPSAWSVIAPVTWWFTAWGAATGFLFATVLSVTERRRAISELSVRRLTVWGAIGAVPLPLVLAVLVTREEGWTWWVIVPLIIAITVGAICAALTGAAAIRGSNRIASDRAA